MIRFPLGRVVATPGALRALEKAEQAPDVFLDGMSIAIGVMCLRRTNRRMSFPSSRGFAFCPRIPLAPATRYGF